MDNTRVEDEKMGSENSMIKSSSVVFIQNKDTHDLDHEAKDRLVQFRVQKDGWSGQKQKNNIGYSNVVPHRSPNPTRSCLTSLSRREAVLS